MPCSFKIVLTPDDGWAGNLLSMQTVQDWLSLPYRPEVCQLPPQLLIRSMLRWSCCRSAE
jgi:hypothetical protein